MNSLQSTLSAQALVYIQFKLLAYVPEHICLSHHTSMSQCTSNIVYIKTPHYCTYKSNNTMNCNFIYHAINIYVPATNKPLKCHRYSTYANYFACRYETTMSVYLPNMNSMHEKYCHDHWHVYIPHYLQMPHEKLPATLCMCPTALI